MVPTEPPPEVTVESEPVEADRDYSDFETQAEAQASFESQGGPEQGPHGLYRNGDGLVCEGLP
jgi:hypothetical protein